MMKKPVSQVAAIHDLSGFGRSSLTVIIPILSSLGLQVCPLPTAVLSTHSAYEDFVMADMTSYLRAFMKHWKKLNLSFDAIYSGFLGAPEQVDIVLDFFREFHQENQLKIVDPVMGDNGKLYGPFNDFMIQKMKKLIQNADVITPNITEAAFLLGKDVPTKTTIDQIKNWCIQLASKGPKIIIITSVPDQQNKSTVIAYNRTDERFWKVSCDYIPANYPGTGDAFTSVIVGALLAGDSLPIALDRAVQFITTGIRATFGHSNETREGILLERVLPTLHAPVSLNSYELI
jgi:pyridoxine kinase